jgi:hypothetical protein
LGKEQTTGHRLRGETTTNNCRRRQAMGDKGKKDKDKSRKQKMSKQDKMAKRKLDKQPRRTP